MKPPAFRYHRPTTVEETVGLLAELGHDAKLIAGGQSLMPMLNMRLATPGDLVDINRVGGLSAISISDGFVTLGALVRQHQAETDRELSRECPLLGQALAHVAHRPIRSRGTVTGSVVHADPAAELPAVFALLDGRVQATGPRGERVISADDFYTGYFDTDLTADELVTAVSFRRLRPGERTAFLEVARRHGDFAICAAAATVHDGTAQVALAGVDEVPRIFDASGLLTGQAEATLDEIAKAIEPEGDVHASADYRRHLARELARRAVAAASGRQANGRGEAQ